MLAHFSNHSLLRGPTKSSPLTIGLVNWQTGKTIELLGKTTAWNWQQGARALWLPNGDWVYNQFDSEENNYVSVVGEVGSSNRKILPLAVQEVSSLGKLYSIDYSVLSKLRPDYGYFCRQANNPLDAKLIEYSADSTETSILASVKSLTDATSERLKRSIVHGKINHVVCNPSGNCLVFMFRYFADGKRITDVYHLAIAERSLKLLMSDRNASHYCWMSDDEILVTANSLDSSKFGYVRVSTTNGEAEFLNSFIDGHPTAITERTVLSDTSADRFGIRHLWQSNVDKPMTAQPIVDAIEPWYLWGERRCDLHPSLSNSRRYWQVDLVRSGRRQICIGPLDEPN